MAQWRGPQLTAGTGGREGGPVELRFHSPYRGWLAGLLTEIAVFAAVIIVAVVLALAAARIS